MRKQKQFYIDVMFTNNYGSEKNFKKMCKFNNWKCRKLPKDTGLRGIDAPNTVYRIYGQHTMDEIYKAHYAFICELGYPNDHRNYPNIDSLIQFR